MAKIYTEFLFIIVYCEIKDENCPITLKNKVKTHFINVLNKNITMLSRKIVSKLQ